MNTETPKKYIKTLQGKVVSAKTKKTIVVLVETRKQHKLYKKIITRSKRFMVHDPDSTCLEGDYVEIVSCRKLSKKKAFILKRVIKKSAENSLSSTLVNSEPNQDKKGA